MTLVRTSAALRGINLLAITLAFLALRLFSAGDAKAACSIWFWLSNHRLTVIADSPKAT